MRLDDFSPITLGCMSLGVDDGSRWNSGRFVPDEASGIAWVRRAVELGISHFDTAQGYGDGLSERWLGKALATVPRDRVLITSKVGRALPGEAHPFSASNIRAVCDRALSNLGTDHLDHFMFHHLRFDDRIDEALAAMQSLQAAGKIRGYAACPTDPIARVTGSLWPQLRPSHWHTHGGPYWHRPADADLQLAAERGEPVVIFAPYLYGLLTGRWGAADTAEVTARFRQNGWVHPWFEPPADHGLYTTSHAIDATLRGIDRVKDHFGVDAAGFRSLLLRYIRALPGTPSICIGFSRLGHIEEAVAALSAGPLPADACVEFHRLIQPDPAAAC